MVPFRWAITSAGKIAADFAHAVRQLEGHEVVAVAARSEAAARETYPSTKGVAPSAELQPAYTRDLAAILRRDLAASLLGWRLSLPAERGERESVFVEKEEGAVLRAD